MAAWEVFIGLHGSGDTFHSEKRQEKEKADNRCEGRFPRFGMWSPKKLRWPGWDPLSGADLAPERGFTMFTIVLALLACVASGILEDFSTLC